MEKIRKYSWSSLQERIRPWHYLSCILTLVSIMVLLNMGRYDLSEWDESRNGINALEMLHNGDYINLHYEGKPDTWNAKPPLMIWMIAISYQLFGYNAFALRFPTFLGLIFFFIYFFKLVRLFESSITAFACCLVLLGCKALLGWHVGLNGDFDALLVFALTASAYYFIRFVEFKDQPSAYLMAVFTGLAFYIKGTAGFVFIPGFFLYALVSGKMGELLKNSRSWLSALLFILIVGSWIFLVFRFGKTTDDSFYGSKNAIETLFLHDTFNRLSNPDFGYDKNARADHLFFFKTLDLRLGLWSFLFYVAVLTGIFILIRKRKNILQITRDRSDCLIPLSVCLIMPLALLLTFSRHTNNWYLAPVMPFIAIITVKGLFYWAEKWKPLYIGVALLFLFTIVIHFNYIYSLPTAMHETFSRKNEIFQKHRSVVTNLPRQDVLLYLKWLETDIIQTPEVSDPVHRGKLLLLRNSTDSVFLKQVKNLKCFEEFCLAVQQEN